MRWVNKLILLSYRFQIIDSLSIWSFSFEDCLGSVFNGPLLLHLIHHFFKSENSMLKNAVTRPIICHAKIATVLKRQLLLNLMNKSFLFVFKDFYFRLIGSWKWSVCFSLGISFFSHSHQPQRSLSINFYHFGLIQSIFPGSKSFFFRHVNLFFPIE